jgi:hypothetical protein
MATTAFAWRGGWILQASDAITPTSVVATILRVYGKDAESEPVLLTALSGGTTSVAETIQQWESFSGGMLFPLAITTQELTDACLQRGITYPTTFTSLTPLAPLDANGNAVLSGVSMFATVVYSAGATPTVVGARNVTSVVRDGVNTGQCTITFTTPPTGSYTLIVSATVFGANAAMVSYTTPTAATLRVDTYNIVGASVAEAVSVQVWIVPG